MTIRKHKKKTPNQYSFSDIAKLYGIGPSTLKLWIEPFIDELGEKEAGYYSQKQLDIMIEHLGLPDISD